MSTKPIPDHCAGLIPYLVVCDAAKAIDFYKQVFGATELSRMPSADGKKVFHAELQIHGHLLMLGDENPQMGIVGPQANGPLPPVSVMLYTPDVDGLFQRATASGAKGLLPPTDMFWGDRYAKFSDPFGHHWGIATHIKDVSPEEMKKGAAEWARKNT